MQNPNRKTGHSRLTQLLALAGGAMMFTFGVWASSGAQTCCVTATSPSGTVVEACLVGECPSGFSCGEGIITQNPWSLSANCVNTHDLGVLD